MDHYKKMYQYALDKTAMTVQNDTIDNKLFTDLGVYRGLRDEKGKGVLTGLTSVSRIDAYKIENGQRIPTDGALYYRHYNIADLIDRYIDDGFGFENTAYLLLFGELPTEEQSAEFINILAKARDLPQNFTRDVIMKAPTQDIMNSMMRSILTLSSYDKNAARTDISNSITQSLNLIAVFPMLAVYAYHAFNHYENYGSMYIHRPSKTYSTAENILRMLRPNKTFTPTEAKVLDACLMLHMEHGGGNNSTFTTRVVTSSGSDTYSAIAAAMSSLKGPKHGGANIKVMEMFKDIRAHVNDPYDEEAIADYLGKILDGETFDRRGLIYGMGHAVYTISDPRERILKKFVLQLAEEKHLQKELAMYQNVEKLAPQLIAEKRHIYKGVNPNVDFYSGFVYKMLGIPEELYTPLFAIARIVGWSAHRLEELVGSGKIIRPAYMSVLNVNNSLDPNMPDNVI